jgi:hypothetical protein
MTPKIGAHMAVVQCDGRAAIGAMLADNGEVSHERSSGGALDTTAIGEGR